jgi:ankyrin repeat protein
VLDDRLLHHVAGNPIRCPLPTNIMDVARGDVLVTHGGRSSCTALHEAANRGYLEIVRLLLEQGADTTVVEPQWGGTPAGWAEHGGHLDIADLLRQYAPGA